MPFPLRGGRVFLFWLSGVRLRGSPGFRCNGTRGEREFVADSHSRHYPSLSTQSQGCVQLVCLTAQTVAGRVAPKELCASVVSDETQQSYTQTPVPPIEWRIRLGRGCFVRRNAMKSSFVGMLLATVVALSMGASVQCEAADFIRPRMSCPSVHPCAPQQRVQPVAQSVRVTVPVAPLPKPYMLPACGQSPYCPPPAAAPPSRSIPVRVDIAVRPEACDQRPAVPVVYRDPGFLGPIISHSIGLIGAAIAAPFRVAEMLCPLDVQSVPSQTTVRASSMCGQQRLSAACGLSARQFRRT